MKILIQNALVWQNDGSFKEGTVAVDNGKIVKTVTPDSVIDAKGALLCPGLLDLHTHGRAGGDFCNADEALLATMAADYARHGVTTVLPTLASDTPEGWLAAMARIGAVAHPAYIGIHLEGRWLAPSRRGAHAAHLLAAPDKEELQRYVRESPLPILRVSAAPELDAGFSFIKACRAAGVRYSVAHTDADYATVKGAMAAGADSFTHLYNAMPPLHHRAGGPVAAALGSHAVAELIVDGEHISPEVVRATHAAKGEAGIMLVSDSMEGTGCPDGTYSIAGLRTTVKNGRAVTDEGKLAGSTANLLDCVRNFAAFTGLPFGRALLLATRTPAIYLGMEKMLGTLDVGADADLFLLSPDTAGDPLLVMQKGEIVK